MSLFRKAFALLLAMLGFLLASTAAAQADPPYRVARLSHADGSVTFSPGGATDWSFVTVNRPLYNGDRLWVPQDARAELQLGGTAVRIGEESSLAILNIDNRIAQIQLTQGAIELRVWRIAQDQLVEIDTPNLAFVVRQPGSYRIEVDPQDGSTGVLVRAGSATLYGEGRAFRVAPADMWRFFDTRLADYDTYRPGRADALARWAFARDRRWERSASARYVSREMIGFEDLDEHGQWRQVRNYGWVWMPTRVSADWAPYREGHWAWIEPWGWTWIDAAPWGFAPSHYGRWAYIEQRWCWIPGPANVRPVYAPALVAFIGGAALSQAGSNVVGWFPLGPREVYRPSYRASRDYFTRVNVTNTVINVQQVVNVYNAPRQVTHVYVNQRAPNAVVAVPQQVFVQARPVAREVVRVRIENVQPQAIIVAPAIAPARESMMGARRAEQRPPEQAFRRQVVAQTAPPPPPPPIETRIQAQQANPGQPAPAASAPARPQAPAPAAAAAAPPVKVVPAAPAASAPPPAASAPNRGERQQRREEREQRREQREDQRERAAGTQAPASAPAATPAPPGRAAPAAPAASPPAAAPAAPAASPPAAAAPPARPASPAAERRAAPEQAPTTREQRREERQDQRREQRDERRERDASAPAAAQPTARPASPPAAPAAPTPPAAPQAAPAPAAPTPPAAPAARAPEPAPAPQSREQRREQREERREERRERDPGAPAASAPAAPPAAAARPAAPPAPPAAPPAPAARAPEAAPTPPAPPAARPAEPASAPQGREQQREQRSEQRRQPASEAREERREQRSEQRRQAASEAREERGRRP